MIRALIQASQLSGVNLRQERFLPKHHSMLGVELAKLSRSRLTTPGSAGVDDDPDPDPEAWEEPAGGGDPA
jgi:hypothetical protein